jgi:outer membrane protein assembly factor BamB
VIQIHRGLTRRSHARNASREALPRPSSRALRFAVFGLLALGVLAAACSGPPKPRGWASARPVVVEDQSIVLVPHKAKVFAFDDNALTPRWQFPPRSNERDTYPVSDEALEALTGLIAASSLDDQGKENLTDLAAQLTISGASGNSFKQFVDASALTDDEKNVLKDLVDDARSFESDAHKSLRAIYGDIGVADGGETALVAAYRGMLFSLDVSTGGTRWVRDVGSEIVGGVAVSGDLLYVGTKGDRLFAFDVATGERMHEFKAKGEIWSTPVIVDGTLYLTSLDGTVYALSPDLQETLWTFDAAKSGIAGNVAVVDGVAYAGSFDNKLYAIDAATGAMKWSIEADNWFWATPVVADGIVYAASLDGKVYAVRASDGSPAWDAPYDAGAVIRSAPVIAGEGLVVASRDARLHKLDLQTGQAIEGTPVIIEDANTLEADLALDERERVYVVPRERVYYVYETAEGLRSLGGVPLPN